MTLQEVNREELLRAVGMVNEAELKLRGVRLIAGECDETTVEIATSLTLTDKLARRLKKEVNRRDLEETYEQPRSFVKTWGVKIYYPEGSLSPNGNQSHWYTNERQTKSDSEALANCYNASTKSKRYTGVHVGCTFVAEEIPEGEKF